MIAEIEIQLVKEAYFPFFQLTSVGTKGYKTGVVETTDCKRGSQILSTQSVRSVTSAENVRDTYTQEHCRSVDTT